MSARRVIYSRSRAEGGQSKWVDNDWGRFLHIPWRRLVVSYTIVTHCLIVGVHATGKRRQCEIFVKGDNERYRSVSQRRLCNARKFFSERVASFPCSRASEGAGQVFGSKSTADQDTSDVFTGVMNAFSVVGEHYTLSSTLKPLPP